MIFYFYRFGGTKLGGVMVDILLVCGEIEVPNIGVKETLNALTIWSKSKVERDVIF